MRILVTGAAGAGSSTLGQALAKHLGATFVDTDEHFWLPTDPPYQEKQTSALRLRSILKALEHSSRSVIAGSIVDWGRELEDSLSHVVYLWVPAHIRVARLTRRESQRFGSVNEGFLEWAAQYDEGRLPGRSRERHERWLAARACPVLRLQGNVSLETAKAQVIEALALRADEMKP